MKNYGVIVAAGKGKRIGLAVNKQFLILYDKPVIVHTLSAFIHSSMIDGLVVVLSTEEMDYFKSEILDRYSIKKPVILANGGTERQYSVYNGLEALPQDVDIVVIHDGARPFVTARMIEDSIHAAALHGGAVVGMPVKDTIKKVDADNFVAATPDRNSLWVAQTPQTFQYKKIMEAHRLARRDGFFGTDDAMLFERTGQRVKMVKGSYQNIKITTLEDLVIARYLLKHRMAGAERGN